MTSAYGKITLAVLTTKMPSTTSCNWRDGGVGGHHLSDPTATLPRRSDFARLADSRFRQAIGIETLDRYCGTKSNRQRHGTADRGWSRMFGTGDSNDFGQVAVSESLSRRTLSISLERCLWPSWPWVGNSRI